MQEQLSPERPAEKGEYPTYYGQPAVKSGHWRWLIIAYFWSGGVAGGSYLLTSVANFFGSKEDQAIARWGRYLAFLFGAILSPILLILDLGRPERFYNMLRVFKLRSPMSVGSWGLSFFGLFSGISAVLQAARDGLLSGLGPLAALLRRMPFRPFEAIGAFFGLFMGGYTGVLLTDAAVPLWGRLHKTSGPSFLCSALATASAATSLALTLAEEGDEVSQRKLATIQAGATVAEGALIAYDLHHLGPLREPLVRGRSAPYFYGALLGGIVLPLTIGFPRDRGRRILKALLTLGGGFLFRAAIVLAGHESGKNPQAYFYYTDPAHKLNEG